MAVEAVDLQEMSAIWFVYAGALFASELKQMEWVRGYIREEGMRKQRVGVRAGEG
jgi:hypothetical protein